VDSRLGGVAISQAKIARYIDKGFTSRVTLERGGLRGRWKLGPSRACGQGKKDDVTIWHSGPATVGTRTYQELPVSPFFTVNIGFAAWNLNAASWSNCADSAPSAEHRLHTTVCARAFDFDRALVTLDNYSSRSLHASCKPT
jgi:hypothetical protein